MTDELIPWLHRQLDRTATLAQAAGGDRWRATGDGLFHQDASTEPGPFAVGPYGYLSEEERRHIGWNDPQRVLRKVEATRRLIHDFLAAEEHGQQDGGQVFGYHATGMLKAIKHAATEYDDQPGYQESWRP